MEELAILKAESAALRPELESHANKVQELTAVGRTDAMMRMMMNHWVVNREELYDMQGIKWDRENGGKGIWNSNTSEGMEMSIERILKHTFIFDIYSTHDV